jgi:hypothetical protein
MIERTRYFEEFLRYYQLAKTQQAITNLGTGAFENSVPDDLMCNVQLYDVVERKYAGFGQILCDVFYGWNSDHPYWEKMKAGTASEPRMRIAKECTLLRERFDLADWAYLFLVHRVCGSAINYAQVPSGYHNTVLPSFEFCSTIEDMVEVIGNYTKPKFTSVGYQFPQFPKPPEGYTRGGDYYLDTFAPRLARDFAKWLSDGVKKKTFREMGEYALNWNTENGLKRYKFQYAAWVADFADYFPEYVELESPFYYGTNAIECISYLAKPVGRIKKEAFLDEVMAEIYSETGSYPFNAEDVACDFIRWIENYLNPKQHYAHLDRDQVWNSSSIDDHPYGRQKKMLELGLIDSFNNVNQHPADDYIIKAAGISVEEYKERVDRSRRHTGSANREERKTAGLVL